MMRKVEVPEKWLQSTVSKYCHVQLGKMLQSEPVGEDDELLPYLRAINISKTGVNFSHKFEMWIKSHEREKYRLRRDDVLVSEGGDAGRTAHFATDDEYYFQNAINRVRPLDNAQLSSRYLYYWFTFLKLSGYVDLVCNIATIAHFTAEKVKAAYFAFPAYETQERITSFLDEKTARIDGLIEQKKALLERLAEKRQAIITQAVTKGLNPEAKMMDSGIDWLGQIPAHWDVKRVKYIAKLESGHTPDKKVDAYWDEGDVFWVSLNDTAEIRATDYLSDTKFKTNALGIDNSSARLLPAKAVVFTRDATIGESAIITRPMAVSQHIIAWICDEKKIIPEYLLFQIYGMTEELRRLTNGATIGTIGLGDVKELVVSLPSIEEQAKIVKYVFDTKKSLDEASALVRTSLMRLSEYRAALITAAVTGQIEGLQ